MKPTAQPDIFPIQILNVKIFLLHMQGRLVLIDTGIPLQERRVFQKLRSLGVDPSRIDTIILTHGHLDHIGCLTALRDLSGARLLCHQSIAPALEQGRYEKAVPRVPIWKYLNPILSKVLEKFLKPTQPDRLVGESLDLNEYGIPGRILHTPGHSPGSCSIMLDEGSCFIGDLLREPSPGSYDTGLFYHDREQILTSLAKIAALKPNRIYLSHGTCMTGKELEDFIQQSSAFRG